MLGSYSDLVTFVIPTLAIEVGTYEEEEGGAQSWLPYLALAFFDAYFDIRSSRITKIYKKCPF